MLHTSLKVALLSCVIILIPAKQVGAANQYEVKLQKNPFDFVAVVQSPEPQKVEKLEIEPQPEEKEIEQPAPPPVTEYTIQQGDNLSKIAEKYQVSWSRIFDKNTAIINPDTISVGQIIVIPGAGEQLAARPLPQPVQVAMAPSASQHTSAPARSSARQAGGSVAGNTYSPGYCTWYAKNRRPDLPNRLGNASSWVARAAAQGYATGKTPQAGAIGQQGNHVVYVEAVNGDGTVTISDMNYAGLYVITTRTVPASSFTYIY